MAGLDPTADATLTSQPDEDVVGGRHSGRLFVVGPRELRGVLVVAPTSTTVGRTVDDTAVTLDHRTVSRRHASLQYDSGGAWSLTDLGSRNGTWLNGARVGSVPSLLGHGDVLRFGDVVAVFEFGAVPDEPSGPTADRIPGQSKASLETRAAVRQAARSGGSTLIEGESGTGKEFVAAEVHRLSAAHGPYVVANCATLSPSLVDSQLFGHERGAFTGAVSAHRGFFRAADGGTLFLDEIGELPSDLQPKLLRAVELGEVVPLGGTKGYVVRTRVVAATNRSLDEEVDAGRFRRDLFARLAMQRIDVSPLRERRADLMLWYELLHSRWSAARSTHEVAPPNFSADALETLLLQRWPENLRGVDRLVHGVGGLLLTRGHDKVTIADIRPWLETAPATPSTRGVSTTPEVRSKPKKPSREEFIAVMENEGWSVRGAARHFERDRRQIYRWLQQFNVRRPDGAPND